MLDLCKTATYSDAELEWIPSGRLAAAGVDPGMGVPLWIGEPGYEAFNDVDSSRAAAVGLTCRPITETIRDTLAWDIGRGGPMGAPSLPTGQAVSRPSTIAAIRVPSGDHTGP